MTLSDRPDSSDPRPRRSTLASHGSDGEAPEALVLLYPGCTVAEVIELITRLADAGWEVIHSSPDGQPFRDRSGLTLVPDRPLVEVDTTAAALVVVPGGDPEAIIGDDRVADVLRRAEAAGALLAGICAGVLVLADAGILRRRAITHNYRPPWAPPEITDHVSRFWEGTTVEPDPSVGVVVDGNVVTALPNATVELTMTIGRLVALFTDDRAERLGRHLRGEYVPELNR